MASETRRYQVSGRGGEEWIQEAGGRELQVSEEGEVEEAQLSFLKWCSKGEEGDSIFRWSLDGHVAESATMTDYFVYQ